MLKNDFVRSTTDGRRILIVDITHMFYKFAYGGAKNLTKSIMVDGFPTLVNTTLPTYSIKAIHRWSQFGYYPTVVCFDSQGCGVSRRAYFATQAEVTGAPAQSGYKAKRETQDGTFYDGINMSMNLMRAGGITALKADGYEADDLVKAAVDKAKAEFPNLPIDVVTSDVDLVPLVDYQVSVFLTSRKDTYAESKDLEKRGYVQITPYNYQEYMEGLTSMSKLKVPYNTVLLTKLLRGDKSDNIDGYPKFTPTKYRKLIEQLEEDNVDLSDICRYDNPIKEYFYVNNGLEIPADLVESTPRENIEVRYKDPACLTKLLEALKPYLDEDILKHIRFVYNGINLNCAFTGLGVGRNRQPAFMRSPIRSYTAGELQRAVCDLGINLPVEK